MIKFALVAEDKSVQAEVFHYYYPDISSTFTLILDLIGQYEGSVSIIEGDDDVIPIMELDKDEEM